MIGAGENVKGAAGRDGGMDYSVQMYGGLEHLSEAGPGWTVGIRSEALHSVGKELDIGLGIKAGTINAGPTEVCLGERQGSGNPDIGGGRPCHGPVTTAGKEVDGFAAEFGPVGRLSLFDDRLSLHLMPAFRLDFMRDKIGERTGQVVSHGMDGPITSREGDIPIYTDWYRAAAAAVNAGVDVNLSRNIALTTNVNTAFGSSGRRMGLAFGVSGRF